MCHALSGSMNLALLLPVHCSRAGPHFPTSATWWDTLHSLLKRRGHPTYCSFSKMVGRPYCALLSTMGCPLVSYYSKMGRPSYAQPLTDGTSLFIALPIVWDVPRVPFSGQWDVPWCPTTHRWDVPPIAHLAGWWDVPGMPYSV
jgi:hypothetical protein